MYQFNFGVKFLVTILLLSALKWNGNQEIETQSGLGVGKEQISPNVFGFKRNIRIYKEL